MPLLTPLLKDVDAKQLSKEELSRRLSFDLAFRLVLAEDDEDVEEPEPPVDVDDDELDEFDKDVA